MVFMLRTVIVVLILFLLYSSVKYLLSPKRKLKLAHEHKKVFLLDDASDIRKNFLLTYRGVMFEGEKYKGPEHSEPGELSIFIWPKQTAAWNELKQEDRREIENILHQSYPSAVIDWKSPAQDLSSH